MSEKLTEIQKIDKNMIFETSIKDEGVAFYDVRKPPFDLYGLCETESGRFHRIPESVAKETNSGVVNLNFHTAGGRVRFPHQPHGLPRRERRGNRNEGWQDLHPDRQ